MILCANPRAQYLAHREEIDEAVARVLSGSRYILGPEVQAFEEEFAAYCEAKHAVGVGSGTEALHVALSALGVGAGDEVITVSHTAVATAAAIRMLGAIPHFVDVEPSTMTMDPSRLAEAVSERTRAIVPVHIYGQPADIDAILGVAGRFDVPVVEDCAQAHGARYRGRRVGSFGVLSCFSFYPTKNLGAIGDGGAVVTSDARLAERVRLLREYGWAERYVSHIEGWNSRLDELQAAILRVKLRHLDKDNACRQAHAARYRGLLAGAPVELPAEVERAPSVYHLFVVRSARRDALQKHLQESGVQSLIHYPVPVHMQPAYVHFAEDSTLEDTEKAAREVLSLPMYPELEESDLTAAAYAVIHALQA